MFGFLRLFLASIVVVNHAGLTILGVKPGPVAVVIFYCISGYVISALLQKIPKGNLYRGFYLERAMRIFPQYWAHLLVAIVFIAVSGVGSKFTATALDWKSVFASASLLPMQGRAVSDYLAGAMYVPTGWSLSLELSFYAIAPFVLRTNRLNWVCGASFIVFALAVAGVTPWPPHTLSYATIFGTFHFFALGYWIHQRRWSEIQLWGVGMACLAVFVTVGADWSAPHVMEVMIASLIVVPLVRGLADISISGMREFDDFAGRISYPVFLNHFLVMWAIDAQSVANGSGAFQMTALLWSVFFACCAYWLVEQPLAQARRSLRTATVHNTHTTIPSSLDLDARRAMGSRA
ncbi:MAG: acyltransferase [Pseudomonadota bacterium]